MEPTPFAQQLVEPIVHALGLIHGAVNRCMSFNSAPATRAFTVGMTDIGEIYFRSRLMEPLGLWAAAATTSTVRNPTVNLRDEMEAGHIELAIGLLPHPEADFGMTYVKHPPRPPEIAIDMF